MDPTSKKPIRLCISGKMKSGKDTAADYLVKTYGGAKVHIAQGVYGATEWILGYRLRGKKIDHEKKTKFERLAMQWVGRIGRLLCGKDIWLRQSLKIIDRTAGNVYVVGVRFPNEVDALKERGVFAVNVIRPLQARLDAGAFNLEHETEKALDKYRNFDAVVNNDSTLAAFYLTFNKLIRMVRGGKTG